MSRQALSALAKPIAHEVPQPLVDSGLRHKQVVVGFNTAAGRK